MKILSQSALAVEIRKVKTSLKWGVVGTLPHILTHFRNQCAINRHLWSKLHNVLQLVEPFKQFCSNRFCERTLIPPTTMGRFWEQRVVLCIHARASRAMKREAGCFRPRCHARLRRAGLRTACARGAKALTWTRRRHVYRGKVTCHKWGLKGAQG